MSKLGSLETGITGNYSFGIGETLSEAWARTQGAKLTLILAGLAYFGILFVASFVLGFVSAFLGGGQESPLLAVVQQVILTAVTLPIGVGLFLLGLKRAVDQPLAVSSIFQYFDKTVPLFLTMLLMYLILVIGFLLLILPGIYLAVAYYLALPLVVEKNLGPWQALEASRKAITHRWFAVFGLVLLLMLINLIGMIPLGIGLIWTVPLTMIAMGVLYRNIFGCESDKSA
jgi:uncharacterized membrane protein